jgi:hypothetical protein
MATHKGSEGTVKVGANAIAELRSWQIEEQADTIEKSNLASTARVFDPGLVSWTGSAEAFWDETDTNGQLALTIGASVTLNFYPEGDSSGDSFYTGTAIVTGISRQANNESMVETSFSFQGSGALTADTVS